MLLLDKDSGASKSVPTNGVIDGGAGIVQNENQNFTFFANPGSVNIERSIKIGKMERM